MCPQQLQMKSSAQKVERGKFALANVSANGKSAPKKATKPADGTPGPKAVAELFKI